MPQYNAVLYSLMHLDMHISSLFDTRHIINMTYKLCFNRPAANRARLKYCSSNLSYHTVVNFIAFVNASHVKGLLEGR